MFLAIYYTQSIPPQVTIVVKLNHRDGDCQGAVPGCWCALGDVLEWTRGNWTKRWYVSVVSNYKAGQGLKLLCQSDDSVTKYDNEQT